MTPNNYATVGDIFEEHCGARQPTTDEQRREVRLGLVHGLCELLSDILGRVRRDDVG